MRDSLDGAMHVLPTRATPCIEWDLGTLISHVGQSVDVLIRSMGGPNDAMPALDCRTRAQAGIHRLLLEIRRAPGRSREVELAALTGSFELALHAWDIAQSTRLPTSLPAELVSSLIERAPVVLGNLDRDGLFDPPQSVPSCKNGELDRLLALFGRKHKGEL